MSIHSLLKQQLNELALTGDKPPSPDEWKKLLATISATYKKMDKNHDDSDKKAIEERCQRERNAGKMEAATHILHDIGNILNNISVSTGLLHESMSRIRIEKLTQATGMIQEHLPNIAIFLDQDASGRLLPQYIIKITDLISEELQLMKNEIIDLRQFLEQFQKLIMLYKEKQL